MKFINKYIDVLKTGKVKAGIKAEKYLDRATNDLGKTKAALRLGQIYEKKGEAEKALKEYLLAATSLSHNGHYPQALTIYKHILKQNPNLDEVALKIGEIYGKMGQLENAHSIYGQLLKMYNKQGKENKAAEVMCLMAELSVEKIAIGKQVQPPAVVPHFSKQTSGNATSGSAPQNIPLGGENGRIPFDLEAELETKPSPVMKRF